MDRFKKKTDENGERTSLKIKIRLKIKNSRQAFPACRLQLFHSSVRKSGEDIS